MGKQNKSIQTIILIIVLTIMLPLNLIAIITYKTVYYYVKGTIIKTQQDALNFYTVQLVGWLENTESYILRMNYNKDWGDLLKNRGDRQYELKKVELLKEIDQEVRVEGIGNISAFWCYIKSTGENLFAYNDVSYEDSLVLRGLGSETLVETWTLVCIGGHQYLHCGYENNIFYMGALVTSNSMIRSWNETSDFPMIIDKADKKDKSYQLTSEVGETGISLTIEVPYSYIEQVMPVQIVTTFLNVVVSVIMIFLSLFLLNRYLTKPLKQMTDTICRIKGGEKELRISKCDDIVEMTDIKEAFNSLMDQIYNLEIVNYKMEIENQKVQLMNLQLQINPHLLLNTLNMIYGLAEIKEYKNIQIFTMDLVKYFRYSLKCTDELVTIHQELEFVKNYVEIQKIRYPESFYILYDVEDELLKEKIPPLILENFVENSIKYSLGNFITEILVIIKKREYFLQVSICDDGAGIDEEILKELEKEKPYVKDGETHVGIYNCVRRLRLFYGENVKFSITSKLGEGTQIWIEFPCTREEKEDEAIIG